VVVKVTPEMIHNWDGSSRLALEAKLILKPDRFTSMQAFRDFGKIVQKMAKKVGVGFVADPEAGLRPKIREIISATLLTSGFITTPSSQNVSGNFVTNLPKW